jgi:quinol monooxygenase YgiN
MAGQGRTSGCSRRSCANPGRPAAAPRPVAASSLAAARGPAAATSWPAAPAAAAASAAAAAGDRKQVPARVYRRSSYVVAATSLAAVRQAVREYVAWVGDHEPDTILYAVCEPEGRGGELVHLAAWKDQRAFAASQASAAYQRFLAVLRPALAGEVRVETADGEPVATAGSRLIARSDVSVQVRLVVKRRGDLPRFERTLVEFTHRVQEGLLASDAFREPGHDRVFYVYERWSSQAAVDAAQGQSPLQLELLEMATLETQVPFSIT